MPGFDNDISDKLSHFQGKCVQKLVPRVDSNTTPMPKNPLHLGQLMPEELWQHLWLQAGRCRNVLALEDR